MSTSHSSAELDKLIREHENLQTAIEADRAWWNEVRQIGIPRFWEMASRLGILRHQLSEHFAQEESAEHEAVKAALQLFSPADVRAMAEQHSSFLRRLDNMIAKANAAGGYECWGEIGLEFSELIHAIDEHEREELRLLGEIVPEPSVRPFH